LDPELDQINRFAIAFGASVDIIHVQPKGATEDLDQTLIESKHVKVISYPTHEFYFFKSHPVASAVSEYASEHDASLIALFTHKLEFIEKILDLGVSRILSNQNQRPLLIFKKPFGV